METVGFEMDPTECDRLNAALAGKGYKFIPAILGSAHEKRTFHVTNYPFSSGLYKNRVDFWQRFTATHLNNVTVNKELSVMTEALDFLLEANVLKPPDFIKLDVEGAELDVLKGAKEALRKCLGLIVEVRFQNTSNCPLFAEADIFLTENGFRLHDFLHLGDIQDELCLIAGVGRVARRSDGSRIADNLFGQMRSISSIQSIVSTF